MIVAALPFDDQARPVAARPEHPQTVTSTGDVNLRKVYGITRSHYTADMIRWQRVRRSSSSRTETPGASARDSILTAITVVMLTLGGCVSNSNGPELLTIPAADYNQAFEAAVEAARKQGLASALRDRRGGVIETSARMAGSVLEPWRTDNASFDQALENTIAYQRRRARFEFVPAGYQPPDDSTATDLLEGPDVLNAEQDLLDLTAVTGELELRVWVFVERATIPGIRRSTWTRSKNTQTLLVYPEGMVKEKKAVTVNWQPVARDPDYERRLLRQVQTILETRSGIDPATTAPATVPASQPERQPLALAGEETDVRE